MPDQQDIDPALLAAAAAQVQAPPVATQLGDVPPGGTADEVDVKALLAAMAAMQQRLDALEAQRQSAGAPELITTAESLRNLIADHFTIGIGVKGKDDLFRLGDDIVDAAKNAVQSGNTGPVYEISQKIHRALQRMHPGGGDHHYFRQALDFAADHVPYAADRMPAPLPKLPGVPGTAPVRVLSGSVTG